MRTNGADLSTAIVDVSAGASTGRLVVLPCVCGGEITADPLAPEHGVRMHNMTLHHLLWRWYETSDEDEAA